MRNLLKYPVTDEERLEAFTRLLKIFQDDKDEIAFGDLTPIIIREQIELLEKRIRDGQKQP